MLEILSCTPGASLCGKNYAPFPFPIPPGIYVCINLQHGLCCGIQLIDYSAFLVEGVSHFTVHNAHSSRVKPTSSRKNTLWTLLVSKAPIIHFFWSGTLYQSDLPHKAKQSDKHPRDAPQSTIHCCPTNPPQPEKVPRVPSGRHRPLCTFGNGYQQRGRGTGANAPSGCLSTPVFASHSCPCL